MAGAQQASPTSRVDREGQLDGKASVCTGFGLYERREPRLWSVSSGRCLSGQRRANPALLRGETRSLPRQIDKRPCNPLACNVSVYYGTYRPRRSGCTHRQPPREPLAKHTATISTRRPAQDATEDGDQQEVRGVIVGQGERAVRIDWFVPWTPLSSCRWAFKGGLSRALIPRPRALGSLASGVPQSRGDAAPPTPTSESSSHIEAKTSRGRSRRE